MQIDADISQEETQNLPAVVSEEQFTLDIKRSNLEPVYNVKRRIARLETVVETLPYWRSFVTVAAFLTSIAFIAIISYLIFNSYNKLPPEFPLIHSQATGSWNLIDKEILPFTPIALGSLLAILLKLNSETFKFDRRLANMVNLGVIIFNILGTIAFVELFSLVLIF